MKRDNAVSAAQQTKTQEITISYQSKLLNSRRLSHN
jgi:hypothetical protein